MKKWKSRWTKPGEEWNYDFVIANLMGWTPTNVQLPVDAGQEIEKGYYNESAGENLPVFLQ